MKELINILSHSNKDIDNQKLMDYLSGKISAEDRHEVEKWMIDNEFINDAVEGLQDVRKEKDIQEYVNQLNKELNTYLEQKKKNRSKRDIKEGPWTYLAIILIIFLAVIAYIIIRNLIR